MAKISELVKTYKLLSDPKAPDWNVRFVGGLVVAMTLVVAAAAGLWIGMHDAGEPALSTPAATEHDGAPPAGGDACPTPIPEAAKPTPLATCGEDVLP